MPPLRGLRRWRRSPSSIVFPNERRSSILIAEFDPSVANALTSQNWIVYESYGISIVDAPWSPNGKALRLFLPGGIRVAISNIQPGGPLGYPGYTVITGTGLGDAYNADTYYKYGGAAGWSGTLCAFQINGGLGSAMNFYPGLGTGAVDGEDTIVIDSNTVAVRWDMTTHAPGQSYTGGGVIGFYAQGGAASICPSLGSGYNTLYNTGFYISSLYRVHELYPLAAINGPKCFFGSCESIANSSIYGGNWPGINGPADPTLATELTGPMGILADWSANGVAGGGGGGGYIGRGYTDGHLAFDDANSSRPDWVVRGVPGQFELEMVGDKAGLVNAEASMWLNKSVSGAPDYQRRSFQFADGRFGNTGYGPRGFTLGTLDNTDGGGGVISPYPKILEFAWIRLSGFYARSGEAPSHWVITVSNPTPRVGDVIQATATLVDGNGDRIGANVNHTPYGLGAAFGSGSDVQMDTDNGNAWAVVPHSWTDRVSDATGDVDAAFAQLGQIGMNITVNTPGVGTVRMQDIGRFNNWQRYGSWRQGSATFTATA